MRSYEILPAGMTGSAIDGGSGVKTPKPYEILPAAGTAEQGLGGWTKGAAAIAQAMPTYRGASDSSFGFPYDPAAVGPPHGGKSTPSMGKPSRSYELMPGAGIAGQGLGKPGGCGGKAGGCGCGGKSGGCGCGGGCGGEAGHDHHPSGMMKSGGCGSGKVGGCGCGGKWGESGSGILLPSSTGILLPPTWSPDGGPAGGAGITRIGGFSPLFDPSAGLDAAAAAGYLSCGELEKIIDDLIARIHRLESAPTPPPAGCVSSEAWFPCDVIPRTSPAYVACHCFRSSQGLSGGTGSFTCTDHGPATPEQAAERQSFARDLCNRDYVLPRLLDQLHRLFEQLNRQGCPNQPPPPGRPRRPDPPPGWCGRHIELCPDPFHCHRNPFTRECLPGLDLAGLRLRPPPLDCVNNPSDPRCPFDCRRTPNDPRCPPDCNSNPSDPRCQVCTQIWKRIVTLRRAYEAALTIHNIVLSLFNELRGSPPSSDDPNCTRPPVCDYLEALQHSTRSRLARAARGVGNVAIARAAAQRAIDGVHSSVECAAIELPRGNHLDFQRCTPGVATPLWVSARNLVSDELYNTQSAAWHAFDAAQMALHAALPELNMFHCPILEWDPVRI